MYLQGLTTGMPPEAQREIVASVKGLENAKILRYGYAIEYDALEVGSIRKTMEIRAIRGLYSAGQINGTSGYEEAAAQGLIAGINAVLSLNACEPYWPSRTRSYIGVLVDDLATWDRPEPYRITPGHAEFRLSLRDDSTERRLSQEGRKIGLVSDKRFAPIQEWIGHIENELAWLASFEVFPTGEMRKKLINAGLGDLKKKVSALDILQRKGVDYTSLVDLLNLETELNLKENDEIYCLETEVKYCGYAERERDRMIQTEFFEKIRLPLEIDPSVFKSFSDDVINILTTDKYDDLSQLVRKKILSKAEIAILISILIPKDETDENGSDTEVTNDK